MLKLKEIRQANHRTQEEVAEFLQITRASYTNIENGKRDPDTQTLVAFADLFGVSMDEIFGRIQKTEKEPLDSLTAEEETLISYFRGFNRRGRDRIMEDACLMANSDIYKNCSDIPGVENKGV